MIRKNRFALIAFVLFSLTIVSGCAKNPVTGESEIMLMSRSEEIKLGRKYYPIMTQMNNGELQAKALQNYVEQLGYQLAEVSDAPKYPYEFNVVNSSVPNAYALPGGFISVTRGLLLEMTSEAQLAAVLGHEIVHVTARHTAQQRTRGIFTNLLMTAGSIYMRAEGVAHAGLYRELGSIGARAILASYSRSQEKLADRVGMRYMAKAGYDPSGMVGLQKLLLKLRENQPGMLQQFFASHPLTETRIDYSKQQVEIVQKQVDIPRRKQLDRFDEVVAEVWKPRQSAYEHYDRGMKLMNEDKFRQAESAFRKALSDYDGEALFHAGLGFALTKQGNPKAGRKALNRALQIYDHVFRIQLYSGLNYFELGEYGKSLKDLEKADSLLPGLPAVTFYRGRNYEELGDLESAARAYRDYLRMAPQGEHADYCRDRLREWSS